MLFNAMLDIAMISIVLALVSQVLQRKFMDKKAMKERQKEMKEKNKRMKGIMKATDAKSKAELQAMQKEMFESMGDMMQGSMKLMMVSLLLYGGIFWFIGQAYADIPISLPVPLPWFGAESLIEMYSTTNWYGWYIVCALAASIVINIAVKFWEKIAERGLGVGMVA